MRSKKAFQRGPVNLFKKNPTARCGALCCAVMICFWLTFSSEGDLIDFFLDNPWRIAILGKGGLTDGHNAHETFWCDRLRRRTDVCLMRGDVHVITGNSSSVILHSRSSKKTADCGRVEMIRPYTRKWEKQTMASVEPVELKCKLRGSSKQMPSSDDHTRCDKKYSVPAVLFSSGGFTGNPYHDFQDVLIPLFIVSQHLKGKVVFVISDMRTWWVRRWNRVLQQLSLYPIVDFKKHSGDHCFPEVLVGLYIHKEFNLRPSLMPNGETMEDFQQLLYNALASPTVVPNSLSSKISTSPSIMTTSRKQQLRTQRLKLLIVAREETRVFLNEKQIVNLAMELRYVVKVVTLSDKIDLQTIYGWFHGSDVVLGVHGAELAHMIFMRRKAVIVQIVPLGTDWPANHYYASPAVGGLGLQYIEYKIRPEESSLSEKYGLWHPIVRYPAHYVAQGWATQKQIYLTEQNVRPSPARLRQTLLTARCRALAAIS